MKLLVVGASGLLGAAVCRAFASAGDEVVGTYATRPRAEATVFYNLADPISHAVGPADVVVLAAPTDNARVTALAVECDRVGAKMVSFFPLGAAAPAAWEQNLELRLGTLFGWSRESDNIAMRVWRTLTANQVMTVSGDDTLHPTSVDYVGEVLTRLLHDGATGRFDVTLGEAVSTENFCRRVARSMVLDTSLLRSGGPGTDSFAPDLSRTIAALGTEPPGIGAGIRTMRRQWLADTAGVSRRTESASTAALRSEILGKVVEFRAATVAEEDPFVPFQSRVNYSGRVYGAEEMVNLVDSALSFWLTMGPYGDSFEAQLKGYLGSRDVLAVSSGSAANLAAVSALTSRQLDRPLGRGDEVITPAVTFPTTLAPIVQNGLVPVFIDCEIGTYNIDPALLEEAVGPRTRAIVIPHTLGNPCDMATVMDVAHRHDLFVVEDTCDALGSKYDGQLVGTFGDLATLSFYPAHHVTTGEGGAVIVNRPRLGRIVRSVRDWGRDCWCVPGEENTCAKRYGWQCGDLPRGFDHKFTYSNIGFNLKMTDMQAAVGVAQLDRLPHFIERRKANFRRLDAGLRDLSDRLHLPVHDPRADPSWFGYPITVSEGVSRSALVQWLDAANIESRMLFAGNILRQPAYQKIEHRVSGGLERSDQVMRDSFFLGVYPGLTDGQIDFVVERIHTFFKRGT